MIDAAAFLRIPYDFKGKVLIYPPKISEVVSDIYFGNYIKILTSSQEELEDEYVDKNKDSVDIKKVPTPFEFLLINCYHNEQVKHLVKKAFYFFCKVEVSFLYEEKAILIGNLEEELKRANTVNDLVLLRENEFFDFQNKIREAIGEKPIEPPNPNEHPKIRRMKALARYRDKIKAKQGKGINLITSLAAICCMGIGITPLTIGEMSYAAIGLLMQTYQEKEKYQLDIQSLLAGADSKKVHPKYWIRNLE